MVNFVHYLLVYAQQLMPSLAHLAPKAGTHAIWADTKTANTDVFQLKGITHTSPQAPIGNAFLHTLKRQRAMYHSQLKYSNSCTIAIGIAMDAGLWLKK